MFKITGCKWIDWSFVVVVGYALIAVTYQFGKMNGSF